MAVYYLDTNRQYIGPFQGTVQEARAYLVKWLSTHKDQGAYIRRFDSTLSIVNTVDKVKVETKRNGKNYYEHFFVVGGHPMGIKEWRFARLNKKGQVCSSWDWGMSDQGDGFGKIRFGWAKPVHKNAIKVKGSY